MSIQLIALDLDGTLLDSHKQLSDRNKQALEACIARGIHVVPCTGRTSEGIPSMIKEIPGIRYAITVNGGMIEDMEKKAVLDRRMLKKETALDVIDQIKGRHIMYDIYADGQGISEERFYNHLDEYNITKEIQVLVRKTRRIVPDIIEYVKQRSGMVDKVNMFFSDLGEREEIRALLKQRTDIIVSSSLYNNLEINGPGAEKGEALLRLASILGLSREETMACGDGDNDSSMIRLAGTGVVMENGDASLKAMADYITGSNDASGVAQAIEKLVLFSI
ncbi:MAG: HAD family phosphatase [Hungatella sp.]|jgi:Cof subfamily protein (haloacid dehalogenase superfamily)|nr:HAD family phosphatase [Hungatella sp.]